VFVLHPGRHGCEASTVTAADEALDRLIAACETDRRVVAAFLGGSRARGVEDAYSDVDATVLVLDEDREAFVADRASFISAIGTPLFLEDFGLEHVTFVIFDDGVELELHVWPVGDLDAIEAGPHRVIYDARGVLEGAAFPEEPLQPDALRDELRQVLTWFWHDVGHLRTALGRAQIWWAAGQVEQLRNACVRLARLEHRLPSGDDEPYWKVDLELPTAALDPLRSTFVPPDLSALLAAGLDLLRFFREHGRAAARAMDVAYPEELDQLVGGELERLGVED
jgi:predicted nucleotidyltransferase